MSSSSQWTIGQEVNVAPRTWPGINKPGGHGKIVKIHYSSLGLVDGFDVKYTLAKTIDTDLEADLVSPHVELNRGRRSRRGRDFLTVEIPAAAPAKKAPEIATKKADQKPKKPSKTAAPSKSKKENIPPVAAAEDAPKKKRAKKNGPVPMKKAKATYEAKKKPESEVVKEAPSATATPSPPTVPRLVVTKPLDGSVVVSPLASCTGKKKNDQSKFRSILPASAKNKSKQSNTAASRPAVATKPTISTATNVHQGRLKRSYDDNLQEASCYIDSLVGTTKNTAAVAKAPAAGAAPRVKNANESLEEERRQQFGRLFSAAMRQGQGEIAVHDFEGIIDSSATSTGCKSFSRKEMKAYINRLCDDGKVMESDGIYYEL